MAGVGRPQGRFKGETEQANALAGFLRELTSGITVRKLAQRYPGGRTVWSEYRSGEKDIPWHLLRRLVHDHAAEPRAREVLLARAAHLHEQAAHAAEGLGPTAVKRLAAHRSAAQQALDRARHAQLLAEEGVSQAEELIRVLLAIVGELRGELGTGSADEPGPAVRQPAVDGGAAELRRSRLREATRCLAEVRSIRQSAHEVRQAARSERDAVGLLVDQESTRARADDGREPGAEPVVADGVRAHLPVLRRLEAELVTVRAALVGRRREVSRMVPTATDSGIVRGELVEVTDNRPTGRLVPGAVLVGPSRRPSAGARDGRVRTGPTTLVAALLAAVLVLGGVLVGMQLGHPGPTYASLDTVHPTAVPGVGPETGAVGGSSSPTGAGPSPSAPTTAPASRPPDSEPPRAVGTEAPQARTALPAAGAGAPREAVAPAPSDRSSPSAPPPLPTASAPVPVTGPPVPRRLGGAPVLPPAGAVAIRNGNSLQCMATPGGGREEGLQVQQFPCGDYPDHFWEARKAYTDGEGDSYYRIVSYNSSLCLAVRESSAEAAAQVVQSACEDDPSQSWRIEKWPHGIRIVNGGSRQCLAVSHGSNAPQAPLMQYPCGDYPDHYWDYGPRR
ncbi:RICIN domain-containing protein [Kitasatospora sp. NPDC036755]|uniref:RICIN domain-containing protein n=1 Tax=Kitasatospora sp. NPDC036755 TaxID=3154600 RepID=UPI0033E0954D